MTTALALLAERGLTYEQEGALWLRTTSFGDDKDRVLRKSDGTFTYLVPDIAYHVDKFRRGLQHLIDVWGADHHGYIPRMRAVLRALGHPAESFEVALVQLVKVVKGGEEVKMSKRAGTFVTLRDLLDDVGARCRPLFLPDAPGRYPVRVRRGPGPEADRRESGVLRPDGPRPDERDLPGGRRRGRRRGRDRAAGDLPAPDDQALLKALTLFPEVVARAARDREPHRVTGYLEDLARVAHGWYHNCRVLGEAAPVERARLVLARAARIVLGNGLALLGLNAPDRM